MPLSFSSVSWYTGLMKVSLRVMNEHCTLPAPAITVSRDEYAEVQEFLIQCGWHLSMTGKTASERSGNPNTAHFSPTLYALWEWCIMQIGSTWFILSNDLDY